MKIFDGTPNEYLNSLPEERKTPVLKLRNIILENLPKGFEEKITYGMLGYVIPLQLYLRVTFARHSRLYHLSILVRKRILL